MDASYHVERDDGVELVLNVSSHEPRKILLANGDHGLAGFLQIQSAAPNGEQSNAVWRIYFNVTFHVVRTERTCLDYRSDDPFCEFTWLNWQARGALAPFGFGWLDAAASGEAIHSLLGGSRHELPAAAEDSEVQISPGRWSAGAVETHAARPGQWKLGPEGWLAARVPVPIPLIERAELIDSRITGWAEHVPFQWAFRKMATEQAGDFFPGYDAPQFGARFSIRDAHDVVVEDPQRAAEIAGKCLVQATYLFNGGGASLGAGSASAVNWSRTQVDLIYGTPNVGWEVSWQNRSVLEFPNGSESAVHDMEDPDGWGRRECKPTKLMHVADALARMESNVARATSLEGNMSTYSFSTTGTPGEGENGPWFLSKFSYQFNQPKAEQGGITLDDIYRMDARSGDLEYFVLDASKAKALDSGA